MPSPENTPSACQPTKTAAQELRTLESFLPNLHAAVAPDAQVQHALYFLIRRALAAEFPNDQAKHPCMPDHRHC